MTGLTIILLLVFPFGSLAQDNPAPATPTEVSSPDSLNAAASSLKVPYMSPMILGRTYDYSTNEVGDDIFDDAGRNSKTTIKHFRTNLHYKMVNDIKDVQDVLQVNGELSVKVKAGLLDISGSGSYLKEESDKTNFVEVLVKVDFETITETLHSSTKPITDWKSLPVIGKHYVRSITYGGMLIASMRFYAKSGKSLQDIKAEIDGKVNAASLSVGVKGQFQQLTSSVEDSSDLVIKYYSTVMLNNVPQDQAGLEKAIDSFPDLVKEQKDEDGTVRGVPLYANVISLSTLDPGDEKLTFVYDSLLAAHLGDLEEMYDDLLTTDRMVKGWLKNQYKLPAEAETKVSTFYGTLTDVMKQFETTIAGMNAECNRKAEEGAEDSCGFEKLTDAFEKYKGEGQPSPRKYYRMFCKVQEDVELAGKSLDEIQKKIDGARAKIDKGLKKSNKDFGKIIGEKKNIDEEFDTQEKLVKGLLQKGESILPGFWFNAHYNGESLEAADDLIKFLYTEGQGQMFDTEHGCMKAPFKGIYLINFHIMKKFVDEDDDYELSVSVVIKSGFGTFADETFATRSLAEDSDEEGNNCLNCDHALAQTVVLKVDLNNFVCLTVNTGNVYPAPEHSFSAILLRKLA